jgi:putative transposase
MQAKAVPDAREQALHERRPRHRGGRAHHGERGSRRGSLHDTERLAQAGLEPSVGGVCGGSDNASAESMTGLDKAETVHRRGPWHSLAAEALASPAWVDRFNHRRLLEPIGKIPSAEAEVLRSAAQDNPPLAA